MEIWITPTISTLGRPLGNPFKFHKLNYRSKCFSLSSLPFHCSASGKGSLDLEMLSNTGESSALSATNFNWSAGTSSSAKIAFAGHSGIHTAQSMHSSGSITRKLGPSLKQSTGHTSTQSVNLHFIQFSVTTWVIKIYPNYKYTNNKYTNSLSLHKSSRFSDRFLDPRFWR